MPQKPDAVQEANIDIDIDNKHIVEVIDMDEIPSKFRDQRKDAMSIVWKFNLWDQTTGVAIMDMNTDLMYELWNFTPDGTWRNEKTGKVAKAREWTEAFLARELSDDEIGEIIDRGFKSALVGKKAVADLEYYTTDAGARRLRIIKLRPLRNPSQPTGVLRPSPSPSPEPVRELVGAGVGGGESKSERAARLRRELELAEKED